MSTAPAIIVPFYDRAKLRSELIRDEGLRLRVYRCTAGKLSIGVGRNLDDVGIRSAETRAKGLTKAGCIAAGITRDHALYLLDCDIDAVEADLDRSLSWWRTLDPVRARVLLNMCFNMGIGTLLTFRNTLAKIRARDWVGAESGMRASKWHGQVGARALRLEAMMLTGKEPL